MEFMPMTDPIRRLVLAREDGTTIEQAAVRSGMQTMKQDGIAKALGGEVVKSERGWGVGMSFNRLTERAAWMDPWQEGLDLVVSHQDQVSRLPAGAVVLAASDFCPVYVMQVGEIFLGVQGHPEFSKAYSADLMELRRGKIPGNRDREGQASLNAPVDDQLMVRWILNFMRQALNRRAGQR